MLWRMLRQSWGRNLRRKVLAIITVFLASSLISALLAVSIDIGDKMSRELKSYGANILIEPAGQAALPALFSESSNPLSGQDFLDEAELPNIKDIFWRNNIVGFAPMLGGEASVEGEPVRPLPGDRLTFFVLLITEKITFSTDLCQVDFPEHHAGRLLRTGAFIQCFLPDILHQFTTCWPMPTASSATVLRITIRGLLGFTSGLRTSLRWSD